MATAIYFGLIFIGICIREAARLETNISNSEGKVFIYFLIGFILYDILRLSKDK